MKKRRNCSLSAPRHLFVSTGFTLIELIVVVAIIGVIAGGTIAGYYKFNERQVMVSTAKEMVVHMRQAQSKATAGVKPTGCAMLTGYTVAATSNDSYTLTATCTAGGSFVVQTYYLPSLIRFAPGSFPFSLTFQGQYGGVTSTRFGGGESTTLDFRSTATPPSTYRIEINKSGSIVDRGFQ